MKLAFIHLSEKQNPYCTSLFITPMLAGFHPPLLSLFSSQTVLLSVFMFQLLRTVGLRAFSMASETYTSGTHSAAFVTCPNDTVARDLARWHNRDYWIMDKIKIWLENKFSSSSLSPCKTNVEFPVSIFMHIHVRLIHSLCHAGASWKRSWQRASTSSQRLNLCKFW